MSRNPYSAATKVYNDKTSKKRRLEGRENEEILRWRKYWREAGPIRFAHEVLVCPVDVPPNLALATPEFPEGVVPDFVMLTEDQQMFLEDIWKRRVKRFILAAGRGAGKTFILGIYVTWRMVCFDSWSMTVMGGSGEQSEKIKSYVDFWRMTVTEIDFCINRSVQSGNRPARVENRWHSYARFPACSDASARGPHVTEVLIDEVGVAEEKSSGGRRAVRSARFQLTASPNSLLGYTSTAQYILGTYYDTWVKADALGFKRYRWSVARHISPKWYKIEELEDGTRRNVADWDYIDEILIHDKDPDNWEPNVWWIKQEDVIDYRKNTSDDEFMVEVLGGMSRGSGLVFGRDDLALCVCDGSRYTKDKSPCEECVPYDGERCPFMKAMEWDKKSWIGSRKAGVDFGQNAPNAMTIIGKRGKVVFVLYSDERTGEREHEILKWVDDTSKEHGIHEIFADPEERAQGNALELRGYSTPNIWKIGKKKEFVFNVKRHMEYHVIFIPIICEYLIDSLYALGYDRRGNIQKRNDHSFDSLMYSMIDFDVDEDEAGFYRDVENRDITKIW